MLATHRHCGKIAPMPPEHIEPVTIASLRAHGVDRLLVYCHGKREGDWPCHHSGTLPVDRFSDTETLSDIGRRCRCMDHKLLS
jgi:hypothetical protein